jgi:hypothetical protein
MEEEGRGREEPPFFSELKSKLTSPVCLDDLEPKKKVRVTVEDALTAVSNCLKKNKEIAQYLPELVLGGEGVATISNVLLAVAHILQESQVELAVSMKLEANVGKVVEEIQPLRATSESDRWYIPPHWQSDIQEVRDTVQFGSLIALALPKDRDKWNGLLNYFLAAFSHFIFVLTGKALLLAHGYRTEGTGLIADLAIKESFLKRLLKVACS